MRSWPSSSLSTFSLLLLPCLLLVGSCRAFVVRQPQARTLATAATARPNSIQMSSSSNNNDKGDPLRAATGIRPSLHPTTINAIADALKTRAMEDPDTPLTVRENDIQPVDVALSAGKIAATAIEKRQNASQKDGMTLTPEEGQTIAGRVVGVVMRFEELEQMLYSRVSDVSWVNKYGEWTTFGVLQEESPSLIKERVLDDPLFALTRAECLLALFLDTVEAPQMRKLGQEPPGGSVVDFLDSDRQEVLLTFQ